MYKQSLINKIIKKNIKNIKSLRPEFQVKAMLFMNNLLSKGHLIYIYSTYRSLDKQYEYRKKYLSGEGGKAAAPGYSWHNYGLAFDFVPVREDGSLDWSYNNFNSIYLPEIQRLRLKSGKAFSDKPHVEDSIGKNIENYAKQLDLQAYQEGEIAIKAANTKKAAQYILPSLLLITLIYITYETAKSV